MQKLPFSILFSALVVFFGLPAAARAGDVSMQVRDEPLGARTLAAAVPVRPFNMLGVHWQGSGRVLFRTHRAGGRWSDWQQADADSAPDGGTGRWHYGGLVWTGAADRAEFRTAGRVTRLRSYRLWSKVDGLPSRHLAQAGSPAIVARSGWRAEEEIVRAKPVYAPALRLAIVHHTVNSNAYTPAQAAAIVRGIEVYHVRGNGWNDIGYNFLVDRYGTIYEGRGGGVDRNVVGAHSAGFNRGTVGIALIGNFQHAAPRPAMQRALLSLLAWRLDVAHVDPLSTVEYRSGGNFKFGRGTLVRLRAISGHRDTGPTECPGAVAYALLPSIAAKVAATGLPKLYAPTVTGSPGGPLRFQAMLSAPSPWTVTVADDAGKTVATGTGTGTAVDWTWRSARAAGYRWTIAAPGALPAHGAVGYVSPVTAPPPPTLTVAGLKVSPAVLVPDASGAVGVANVSFTLSGAATVSADVVDSTGAHVLAVVSGAYPAGPVTAGFSAAGLLDGRYTLAVAARGASGATATAAVPLVVDRTLRGFALSGPAVSPNGDGRADTLAIAFTLAQAAPVSLMILHGDAVAATVFQGPLAAGPQAITWDGTSGFGTRLPDGAYTAVLTWTDALGDVSVSAPVAIDTTPPALTLLDAKSLRFSLSESASVVTSVNGGPPVNQVEPAGVFSLVPPPEGVASVWAQPQDAAGNLGPPVTG